MTDRTICIPLERYDELIKKEKIHDTYAEKLKSETYASELEKALFGIKKDEF